MGNRQFPIACCVLPIVLIFSLHATFSGIVRSFRKNKRMKLPKALLGAIVIGIAVQATSCGKDKDTLAEKQKKEAKKDDKNKQEPCPVCGLG